MTATNNTKLKRKRIWRSIVTTLAAIVVFVTTYALIIPAITWEKTLICPLEEHLHTDFCYNSKGELKCGKEEHKHTDACFDAPPAESKLYYCGLTAHVHDENCYFEDGTLKCTLQEHTHTDACLFKNNLIMPRKFLAAGGGLSKAYLVDDQTDDGMLNLFKVGGRFVEANDGKVVVDKSVYEVTSEDQFDVVLSALGQSYNQTIREEDMIHPDVVFIVDISTSMAGYKLQGEGDVSRLAGLVDALNTGIGKLLRNDPKTRISVVAYATESYGPNDTNHYFYLPLNEYNTLPSDNYVLISERSSTGQQFSGNPITSRTIKYNTNWTTKGGSSVAAQETCTRSGTYTQAGLMAGLGILETASADPANVKNRQPVLILISDGEPRTYRASESNDKNEDSSAHSNVDKAITGYWTVRTAAYVRQQLQTLYPDAHNGLFYTMGPGITSLYGRTILDPGGPSEYTDADGNILTNLEACYDQYGSSSTDGKYSEANLYYRIMDYYTHTPETDLSYSDFADWSRSGEMTPTELQVAMLNIIASIQTIPRPIITTYTTSELDIIDSSSLFTFTDTLGDNMEVSDTVLPYISYRDKSNNEITFTANAPVSGTLGAGSEYAGCPYKLYRFIGSCTELSTDKVLNMNDILLYEITQADGSKVVLWQFPADLLPIIYHNVGLYPEDSSDDTYTPTPPLKLHFIAQPKDGIVVPGETYYSNSTADPTKVTYIVSEDNPYYTTNRSSYTAKGPGANKTETLAYSSDYNHSTTTDDVEVLLGNNGMLYTPLTLDVHKTWSGSATPPSSVTVTLYANGVSTGETVTLNSGNHWSDQFGPLAKYDSGGNLIVYTVKENVPSGYTVTGESAAPHLYTVDISSTTPAAWETVTTMTTGEKYRIHFGSNTSANVLIGGSSDNTISVGSPSKNTTTQSEQWEVVNDSGTLRLRNVQSGKYLRLNNSANAVRYSTSKDTTFTLNANSYNRKIQLTRGGNTGYLRVDETTISVVSSRSDGTALTIERLVPEETVTVEESYYGFELLNDPLKLTFSAEKIWESGTTPKEITLQVYNRIGGTVSTVGTLKLNAAGDWKGTYTLSGSDFNSSAEYFVAETTTGDFTTSYSAETVDLTYGGKTFKAVPLDKVHAVSLTITNKAICVPLPATGGIGTTTVFAIGALLMFGALTIGCVLWRRREGRGEI